MTNKYGRTSLTWVYVVLIIAAIGMLGNAAAVVSVVYSIAENILRLF